MYSHVIAAKVELDHTTALRTSLTAKLALEDRRNFVIRGFATDAEQTVPRRFARLASAFNYVSTG